MREDLRGPFWVLVFVLSLGDFCHETYRLACLLARHLCRANPHIERLCGGWRFAMANENPAPCGMFHSGNRLRLATKPKVSRIMHSRPYYWR